MTGNDSGARRKSGVAEKKRPRRHDRQR